MILLTFYVLPFLALIWILIAIHEGGHYLAARRLGIRVTHFSIGFGPTLLRWTDRHGCCWRLSAIPLGGYVRMWGDQNAASAPSRLDRSVMSTADAAGAFHLRPVAHRAWVVAAGPLVNLVLGLGLIIGLYMVEGRVQTAPVVTQVIPDSPAASAGLLPGDRMIAVDGTPVGSFQEVVALTGNRGGEPVRLTLRRASPGGAVETIEATVVPEIRRAWSLLGQPVETGRVGIMGNERVWIPVAPLDAARLGFADTWRMTGDMLGNLQAILVGLRPIGDLAGPIRIAQVSGAALQQGLPDFLLLAALISLNLGIMNLLPVPVLDGGHLALCAAEAVRRRPLPDAVLAWAYRIGGLAVLALSATVLVNDLRHFI